jgi:CheY-like chemotaxis protein
VSQQLLKSSPCMTSKAGLHHKFEQCRRVAKRIIEFVLGAKTPPLLTKKKMAAGASTARLKTERDTPAIQAADGISSPPHGSLPTEEPMGEWDLVPEGKQRVWCNHCEMLSINGVPCHESDCPNVHKVWDPTALPLCQTSHPDRQYGEWVNREHFAATTDKSDNPVPGDEQGLFTPLAHDPSSCTAEVAKAGRILVVDDEEAIRAIIVSMLVSAGYECREAAGGLEALAVLESGEQFDLMLDDLMMPGLDGIGLLERSKDKYPDMPVVIVTAVQSPEASLCPLCRPRC